MDEQMEKQMEEAAIQHTIHDFATLLESMDPYVVMCELMDVIDDDAGDKLARVMRTW